MGEVSIIRLDLAKNMFQVHGAGTVGSVTGSRSGGLSPRVRGSRIMASATRQRSGSIPAGAGAYPLEELPKWLAGLSPRVRGSPWPRA